jgi:hypothetical protein
MGIYATNNFCVVQHVIQNQLGLIPLCVGRCHKTQKAFVT